MEIERKYLVRELPADLDSYPHTEIEQGYLCTSPTLRIRRMGDAFILTVKEKIIPNSSPKAGEVPEGRRGMPAIVNREEEFSMRRESYERLRAKCDGRIVSKTRYRIPLSGSSPKSGEGDRPAGVVEVCVAELDIFHAAHEGLCLVEVEFPSVEAADAFVPPVWFGEEVSGDPRYRNSYLASI